MVKEKAQAVKKLRQSASASMLPRILPTSFPISMATSPTLSVMPSEKRRQDRRIPPAPNPPFLQLSDGAVLRPSSFGLNLCSSSFWQEVLYIKRMHPHFFTRCNNNLSKLIWYNRKNIVFVSLKIFCIKSFFKNQNNPYICNGNYKLWLKRWHNFCLGYAYLYREI